MNVGTQNANFFIEDILNKSFGKEGKPAITTAPSCKDI
jgi:hypothetical protein